MEIGETSAAEIVMSPTTGTVIELLVEFGVG